MHAICAIEQVCYRTEMQTALNNSALTTRDYQAANAALRSCVHCGFCNATCPTYQLLGNELDGPRGRIYLIKQSLEGELVTAKTLSHLDRCLTCRACETTCPSGVPYAELLEIGRSQVLSRVKRPVLDRAFRYLLRQVLPYPQRLEFLLRLSPWFKWLLPSSMKNKLNELPRPRKHQYTPAAPTTSKRHMILLGGCAQAAIRPDINAASIRVLAKLNIHAEMIYGSGCCGALSQHMDAPTEAKQFMRRNIDAWWPAIENGVDAIITSASACSLMVKDYGRLLADDPDYSEKAAQVSAITLDLSEALAREDLNIFSGSTSSQRVAVQSPCTAQHGQLLTQALLNIITATGHTVINTTDKQMCCGAAGTYTVLQPELSQSLRKKRLDTLQAEDPSCIVTANIGCLVHLQHAAAVPVKHWIELLDEALPCPDYT